ncbi:MAG: ABC transporter ATP-binding protein [Solirubrobacterales bacterium]
MHGPAQTQVTSSEQQPVASRGVAPMRTLGPAVVRVNSVSLDYRGRGGETTAALDHFDLTIAEGERVALLGPSGCGKSTLLSLIAGLLTPASGSISVDGAVALMPQSDLLVPWRSALRNAALALEAQGVPRAEAIARAEPLFARFGLAGFENARAWELSGGMRQRVAFLRTVLTGRPILALDEPFGALDAITRGEMHEWLGDALAAEPRTVLLVTHDVEEALTLADRVVVMSPRPGRVAAEIAVDRPADTSRQDWITSVAFSALKSEALAVIS